MNFSPKMGGEKHPLYSRVLSTLLGIAVGWRDLPQPHYKGGEGPREGGGKKKLAR